MSTVCVPPSAVSTRAETAYRNRRSKWVADPIAAESDSLSIALHPPSERQVAEDPDAVVAWVRAWQMHRGIGRVHWETRRWPSFGTQDVPVRVVFAGPGEIAAAAGRMSEWHRLTARRVQLVEILAPGTPALADAIGSTLSRWLELGEADFVRLVGVVRWLADHPASGVFIRQLPVPGVDTKWISRHRGLVEVLLEGAVGNRDLGVRSVPRLCEIAVCDRTLLPTAPRHCAAPLDELAELPLHPERILVLENKEGLHALPDLPGTVAVHGSGYAVHELAALSWLADSDVVYWGDLDTHGFVILDRFRAYLPDVRSFLMDLHTLEAWSALAVEEPSPSSHVPMRLTPAENEVFTRLRVERLRLEQERIPWPHVMEELARAFTGAIGHDRDSTRMDPTALREGVS
ncbi:DUF3322 domain-containing protein [Rhodococcus sp. p52]|uniref:DUF3322 domain-containing protein n=1 Tax=Rhodococcus sp. p52 TaxID=935199 RepID=UPI0009ED2AF6|nr:DUF3322 domain-containing protein [Rhodococcus sp. p52]